MCTTHIGTQTCTKEKRVNNKHREKVVSEVEGISRLEPKIRNVLIAIKLGPLFVANLQKVFILASLFVTH